MGMRHVLTAAILSIAPLLGANPGGRPVCLLIFRSKDCPSCKLLDEPNIAALGRKLGCEIRARRLSVEDVEQYTRLVRLEQQSGDEGNELPVVFVGKHVLGGKKEIERSFAATVERYARDGGAETFPSEDSAPTPAPAPPSPSKAERIYIASFDTPGCRECRRVEHLLRSIVHQYPSVEVRTFLASERESRLLQEALAHRAGVPESRRLLTPAVFVGATPFIREDATDRAIRQCIEERLATGTACPWEGGLDLTAAERRLEGRMQSLGLAAVVVGGLIDGINPCAFATLILFVSAMTSAHRERRKVLAIGLSFIAAVFASYLAVGMGLTAVVRVLEQVPFLDAVVTWAIVGLCAVLAFLSARDALMASRGQHRSITLQLPKAIKEKVRLVLVRFGRTPYLVLGGLLIGALISMLELVCTGQIYFPLIKLMVASSTGDRMRAVWLLLVYNMCFIAPLLVVLGASYCGATSERLTAVLKRHMAATKTVTAVFFAGLATLLLVGHYHW